MTRCVMIATRTVSETGTSPELPLTRGETVKMTSDVSQTDPRVPTGQSCSENGSVTSVNKLPLDCQPGAPQQVARPSLTSVSSTRAREWTAAMLTTRLTMSTTSPGGTEETWALICTGRLVT